MTPELSTVGTPNHPSCVIVHELIYLWTIHDRTHISPEVQIAAECLSCLCCFCSGLTIESHDSISHPCYLFCEAVAKNAMLLYV